MWILSGQLRRAQTILPLVPLVLLVTPIAARAQTQEIEKVNPVARNAESIQAGKALYLSRQTLCSNCHGADARGGEAPDLYTSRTVSRGTDQRLFEIIKRGVPGSGMPPQPSLSDAQVWQLAAYLQSLGRPGRQAPVAGDARRGTRIFDEAGCRRCHMIQGSGGFLGPDLSDIATRLTTDELRRAIVSPAAEVRDGFRPVVVVTATGQRITGLLKNDSNFSMEILRTDGTYFTHSRALLRQLSAAPATLMPSDYQRTLTPEDLQSLLAFLDGQRAEGRAANSWLVKAH